MKRFAIYYAPPEGAPLTRAASAWLGRHAFTGEELPGLESNGFSREQWEAITADPRVYGFHATLKPPFRLAEGATGDDLRAALRSFAASRKAFEAFLKVGSIERFAALVLAQPCPEFVELAADCVRRFDRFRAAPSEQELDRRRKAPLNPAQLAYLMQWGYPYVLEEWRFHMTLTASLTPEIFCCARDHLSNLLEPYCREPVRVDSICLFEQEAQGAPFVATERFSFA